MICGSLMLIIDYKLFRRNHHRVIISSLLTARMSYFQKYQRTIGNSRISSLSTDLPIQETPPLDPKRNSDSRESYLKAFKKYYIDQLISQKAGKPGKKQQESNKQNFCFHEPPLRDINNNHRVEQIHSKSCKEGDYFKQRQPDRLKAVNPGSEQKDLSGMNRSKMVAMVRNKESEIEELLYSSISQFEREMMGAGQGNDLLRENKMLRGSIERLKLILKEKLQVALKRNKEELTMMFDEYSSMIKKLLEDKEQLTAKLQESRSHLNLQEQEKVALQEEYQNRIRIIVEENNAQVSSTKQQIEEFLDMIIQFEEEANAEKEQLQKLREKVVELEMENNRLKESHSSEEVTPESSLGSMFARSSNSHQMDPYTQKIQSLLGIVDRLQQENDELNQFLKLCKCSKIKRNQDNSLQSEEQIVKKYENKLIEKEKEFIREEMQLREVLKKKDHCIDRLHLVIEEMRKGRYESVDRMTEEALSRQLSK